MLNRTRKSGGEPCKKRDAWIVNVRQIVGLNRAEDEEEEIDDVYHWPCDRDREFLHRLLWHALHARYSPNGQQCHIRCRVDTIHTKKYPTPTSAVSRPRRVSPVLPTAWR